MSVRGVADVLLGVVGVGIFIYGDVVTNRTARLAGVVVITVCVIAGAIMAVFREDGH